jgi:large subunit ribosomal protein L6
MSRIGKQPIIVPSNVKIDIDGRNVKVTGPKGTLEREVVPEVRLHQEDGRLVVTRPTDSPRDRAMHGLTRALLANMVTGVDAGFRRTLELVGVGYRAQMAGSKLTLALGFSHPVEVDPPEGITFSVEGAARPHRRHRQGSGRTGGGEHPQDAPTRAVPGQGHPLPGRSGAAQGR